MYFCKKELPQDFTPAITDIAQELLQELRNPTVLVFPNWHAGKTNHIRFCCRAMLVRTASALYSNKSKPISYDPSHLSGIPLRLTNVSGQLPTGKLVPLSELLNASVPTCFRFRSSFSQTTRPSRPSLLPVNIAHVSNVGWSPWLCISLRWSIVTVAPTTVGILFHVCCKPRRRKTPAKPAILLPLRTSMCVPSALPVYVHVFLATVLTVFCGWAPW